MISRKALKVFISCLIMAGAALVSSCSDRYSGPSFDGTADLITADKCSSNCGGHFQAEGDELDFCYVTSEAGYYDLNIEYIQSGSEDHTLGLFIDDHFFGKVEYASSEEGTAAETVYLDKGDNIIRFKFIKGDGDVTVTGIRITPSDSTISLVVAPHEDDEILAFSGIIENTLNEGGTVKVLLLTNGDYFSSELGPVRIRESIAALAHIGVPQSDIILLGYGDAQIAELYMNGDDKTVLTSKAGFDSTYGVPELNMFDYHTLDTGSPASYSGFNLSSDMFNILSTLRPQTIYTTSEAEWHPDHKYASRLVCDTIVRVAQSFDYHPVLCQSVIHGEVAEWPDRDSSVFDDPFPSGGVSLDWEEAVHFELTEEMMQHKHDAISEYVSQNDGTEYNIGNGDFNYAFCKEDEFYWVTVY